MFRGTFISQIISVIGTIYLAKIYKEESFGFLGVFISIASISSIINTLQLEKCIITSTKKNIHWFNFLFFIVPINSVFIYFILVFASYFSFSEKITLQMIFLSTFGGFLFSLNKVHENLCTYKKEFTIVSNVKIFIILSNIILQSILFIEFEFMGLIYGVLISQLVLVLYFFKKNIRHLKLIHFKEIKNEIKANISIVKYLMPSNTINSLALNIMPILILTFFTINETGVYFLSTKILAIPLSLISLSISQVYFQKASELYKNNKRELFSLTKKIVAINLILMLFLVVLINTFGVYLLELFFNKSWQNLGLFVFILSFLTMARASFNPISSLIIILNKNQVSLLFNIYLLLINLLAIYIGVIYQNIVYSIICISILGGFGYLFLSLYFMIHLKQLNKDV